MLEHEIPILQFISNKSRSNDQYRSKDGFSISPDVQSNPAFSSVKINTQISRSDEALTGDETFKEYTDVLLRSFPFSDIIEQITYFLDEAGFSKLYVFFDDYSELSWYNQRVFVDVVLSPLNNNSNEKVKIKVAAYPGRIYYGKIDPSKIDTIYLDFFNLYRSHTTARN